MECPQCGSADTGVIDSRPSTDAIRRRRECAACSHRFTTYERIAELEPAVVKRDGRREPFQPEKIRQGIHLAAVKRPLPQADLDAIVEHVRTRATQSGRAEIASLSLGEWVWEQLRHLDEVAAFRFASVFRRPDNTAALRRELAVAEAPIPDAVPAVAEQPRLPGIASALHDGDRRDTSEAAASAEAPAANGSGEPVHRSPAEQPAASD